jgi:chromosome segregation ATPase
MKDIAAKFTEVERRVRSLVDENHSLRGRLRELEQQLADARRDARDLERSQGKAAQVREKLERVLRSLEALGTDDNQAGKARER